MQDFLTKIKFEKWKAWIYLLPAIILLLIFTAWPIVNTVRLSFLENYDIMREIGENPDWKIGLGNFEKVIFQQKFWKSVLKITVLPVRSVGV